MKEENVQGQSDQNPNFLDSVSNWFENAYKDASDWVVGAGDTIKDAANTAGEWIEQAANDAGEWAGQAANDAGNWVENAYKDASDWVVGAGDTIKDAVGLGDANVVEATSGKGDKTTSGDGKKTGSDTIKPDNKKNEADPGSATTAAQAELQNLSATADKTAQNPLDIKNLHGVGGEKVEPASGQTYSVQYKDESGNVSTGYLIFRDGKNYDVYDSNMVKVFEGNRTVDNPKVVEVNQINPYWSREDGVVVGVNSAGDAGAKYKVTDSTGVFQSKEVMQGYLKDKFKEYNVTLSDESLAKISDAIASDKPEDIKKALMDAGVDEEAANMYAQSLDKYEIDENFGKDSADVKYTDPAVTAISRGTGVYNDAEDRDKYENRPSHTVVAGGGKYNEFGYYKLDKDGKLVPTSDGKSFEKAESKNIVTDPNYSQKQTLASTSVVTPIVNTYGNPLGNPDISSYSKLDYMAVYAASGQRHTIDLNKTMAALAENGVQFAPHPKYYYYHTIFEQIRDKMGKGQQFAYTADQLKTEVDELKKQYLQLHQKFDTWIGEASNTEKECFNLVAGFFDSALLRIDQSLIPACKSLEALDGDISSLQSGEDGLFALTGTDGDGNPMNPSDESLYKLKLKELTALEQYKGACRTVTMIERKPEADRTEAETASLGRARSAKTGYWNEYEDVRKKREQKEDEVEAAKCALDGVLETTVGDYYQIKHFETSLDFTESFFDVSTTRTRGDSYHPDFKEWVKDANSVLQHTEDFRAGFEDFRNMPVITPLSGYFDENGDYQEYKIGDQLFNEYGHNQDGDRYIVTAPYDPITGTIKIRRVDKDGKPIGEEITIWDSREIVPDDGNRDWIHTQPPTEQKRKKENKTEEKKTEEKKTEENKTEENKTEENKTEENKTEENKTEENKTEENKTEEPPTDSEPPTNKPDGPDAPHTGLDAMYGSNSGQSSAGLGALAGLALGAAGLGLTGLAGNKEDKKKEEKEDKEESKSEEFEDVRDENPLFQLNHSIDVDPNAPVVAEIPIVNNNQ